MKIGSLGHEWVKGVKYEPTKKKVKAKSLAGCGWHAWAPKIGASHIARYDLSALAANIPLTKHEDSVQATMRHTEILDHDFCWFSNLIQPQTLSIIYT